MHGPLPLTDLPPSAVVCAVVEGKKQQQGQGKGEDGGKECPEDSSCVSPGTSASPQQPPLQQEAAVAPRGASASAGAFPMLLASPPMQMRYAAKHHGDHQAAVQAVRKGWRPGAAGAKGGNGSGGGL